MTKRREFSKATKARAFLRANGCCEEPGCGVKIMGVTKAEYDHITPCGLGGGNSLENCKVLCVPCHKGKTRIDKGMMAKADRARKRHTGTKKPHGRPIPGSKRSGVRKRMNGDVEKR